MIPLDFVPALAGGPWPVDGGRGLLLLALSTGILGMGLADFTSGIAGRFAGDDDETEDRSGGEDFMDGEVGDDFLEGDGGDDEFGELGGWEDDDELDDFGGDGGGADEVEPRLKELENEVASISSTMGTVRSENESISETVEDIEDNIRKLLEIYEMVTRGVNPFVDDVEGAAGMGGSFGLFEGEGPDDEVDELDPEVADADADSFFDDDWDDGGSNDDEFDDELDDELDGGFGEGDVADRETDEAADSGGGEEGGKTFDQLKSEYEGGDAEWSEEDGVEGSNQDGSGPSTSDTDPDEGSGDESAPTDGSGSQAGGPTGAAEDPTADAGPTSNGAGDKPYLRSLPGGYGADLLVIEWLSYLRGCSNTAEALRAIRYYETIGWLGEPAAEALTEFLMGLEDGDGGHAPGSGTQLTVDHHTHSLHYIGRLGDADVQIERLDWAGSSRGGARLEGGEQRGIQR